MIYEPNAFVIYSNNLFWQLTHDGNYNAPNDNSNVRPQPIPLALSLGQVGEVRSKAKPAKRSARDEQVKTSRKSHD